VKATRSRPLENNFLGLSKVECKMVSYCLCHVRTKYAFT